MAVQPGLCRTWSEIPKTGFLTTRLICSNIDPGSVVDQDLYYGKMKFGCIKAFVWYRDNTVTTGVAVISMKCASPIRPQMSDTGSVIKVIIFVCGCLKY